MVWRLLIILFACFAAMSAPGQAQDRLIWGANGHPFTAYPGIKYDTQLSLLRDLGLTSYRVNLSSINQTAALRMLIDKARASNIDILPVLTPPLDLTKGKPTNLYKKAKAFAMYFVSRFKDDIRVWELGNELENFAIIQPCEKQDDGSQYNCNWGPASGVGSLEYYGPRWRKVSAVLKGLSDGTVSVDPEIRKAMGTAGWGHIGAFERMRQDGIAWDISVWHFYDDNLEWGLKQLEPFGKPIWLTEFNHPYGSQKGEDAQATGLAAIMKQVQVLSERYRIEAAHIYELLDEPYWAPSFEAHMGLVRLKKDGGKWTVGMQKPAYCAVRSILRNDSSTKDGGCDLCSAGARNVSYEAQLRYGYCLVLQRDADGHGLQDWMISIKQGKEPAHIAAELFRSNEAASKYGTKQLNNSEFIRLVYRILLQREPDTDSHERYLSRINSGEISRSHLIEAVITSEEFAIRHPILFARHTTE